MPKVNMKSKSKSMAERAGKRVHDSFVDLDIFGQPIALNFKGRETYKTCLGSFLTLFFYFIVFNFILIKGRVLRYNLDWDIK